MGKKILVYSIILLLASCTNNSSIYKLGKRVVCSTNGIERQVIDPVDSIYGACTEAVWGIHCICDSIAILDLTRQHPFCYRALNLNTNDYYDFLTRGRGPNEVLSAYFSRYRKERDTTYIDVTGMNEYLLMSINLNETLKSGYTVVTDTYNTSQNVEASYFLNDYILSVEPFGQYNTLSFCKKDNPDNTQYLYPFGDNEVIAMYQPLFNSTKKIKPDGTLLSMSMFSFDEINIFDINGKNNISISTSKKCNDQAILKEAITTQSIGGNCYYFHHDVTDDNIFALYYDCPVGETSERTSSTIHVFSWEGQLEKIIQVNEQLIGLAVSEDGSTMYGLSGFEVLYKYKLQ